MKAFIRELRIGYYMRKMLSTDGSERIESMNKMVDLIRQRDSAQVKRMEASKGLK